MKKIPWPKSWLDGIEWFSTVTGLVAATFIACNLGYVWAGYMVFLLSSVALIWAP